MTLFEPDEIEEFKSFLEGLTGAVEGFLTTLLDTNNFDDAIKRAAKALEHSHPLHANRVTYWGILLKAYLQKGEHARAL